MQKGNVKGNKIKSTIILATPALLKSVGTVQPISVKIKSVSVVPSCIGCKNPKDSESICNSWLFPSFDQYNSMVYFKAPNYSNTNPTISRLIKVNTLELLQEDC